MAKKKANYIETQLRVKDGIGKVTARISAKQQKQLPQLKKVPRSSGTQPNFIG